MESQLQSLASRLREVRHAMTPEETAEMLRMKRQTLMRRAKLRLIPSFHNGRAVLFDPAALSRWLVEQGAPKFHKEFDKVPSGKRKLITHETHERAKRSTSGKPKTAESRAGAGIKVCVG